MCKIYEHKVYKQTEVRVLRRRAKEGREKKFAAMWCMNCEQLSEYDKAIALRDEELMAKRTDEMLIWDDCCHMYPSCMENSRSICCMEEIQIAL